MISYPYVIDLYTNVLRASNGIGGRFYVSKRFGTEINSDQLEEVLKDIVATVPAKKYPLAIMMPPVSYGSYVDPVGEWEELRCTIFFLTPAYYTGNNQLQAPNPNTQTSTHTIPQTWHDMKRCAVNFLVVVNHVQKKQGLVNTTFRLAPGSKKVITPISEIGIDLASGVRLDFTCAVFSGCTVEDYTQEAINLITVPADDSHPEHNL